MSIKRLFRLFLFPLWVLQLATGAKSFLDNPIIGSERLNRRGLHVIRLRVAHALAANRRRRLASQVAEADRAEFERDGLVVKRDFLPPDAFRSLIAEIRTYRGPAREMVQGDTITRRIALDRTSLPHMPTVRRMLDSPEYRGLLRYVCSFDGEPMLYLQTILGHAMDGPPDPQLELHSDAFQPSVKAWLFLNDVKADAAPLTFVPRSHRPDPPRLAWEREMSIAASQKGTHLTRRGSFRLKAADLSDLGLPAPRILDVPANTLVVADTYGFHARGPSNGPSFRVEIWAFGRQSPFVPWTFSPLWRMRWLARRRAALFWWSEDLLERFGLGHNVWRARENMSAFDGEPNASNPQA
jgi:hypothetical protein